MFPRRAGYEQFHLDIAEWQATTKGGVAFVERMSDESALMRLFRKCGLESLAWSLRRLHCPVDKNALVLEVGSGGNPYIRANVLLDAYEETGQRHWVPLVSDRPTVMGFAENLPFKNKVFDFVIASHVLEHSADPERFIAELQRVGKAGYIEVPDACMERIIPYPDHRLEITLRSGTLIIRKKPAWMTDPALVELFESRANRVIGKDTIPRHPFSFHVRYYWENEVHYIIENPEVAPKWIVPDPVAPTGIKKSTREVVRNLIIVTLRKLLSQSRRNRTINLIELLRCPRCHADLGRVPSADSLICVGCRARFPLKNGIPQFSLRLSLASPLEKT